jgi:branched-chain amino acid aminotransferase
MHVFLNNRLVPESEATVSVYDHGFLYGDGVYETMRAYDGVVFKIAEHIDRLGRSATFIKLSVPEEDFIRDAVCRTVEANKLSDAYIRVTVSRGSGPIGLDPALCREPTFVVIAREFSRYPDAYYSEGVKVIIARTRRNLNDALNPEIKSLNFLNNILAMIEAKEHGANEAIMLNHEGFLAEGTVSNLFFVKDDALCTPSVDVGILSGITRETVIGLARGAVIKVNEGMFRADDLFKAAEVFYTNTSSEIMPVSRVNNTQYSVGEVTRHLLKLYRNEVAEYIRKVRSKE